MSKEFSANIHDPNHRVDDYDLYFNGDLIEGGLERTIITGAITLETGGKTILINSSEPIPDDFYLIVEDSLQSNLGENMVFLLSTIPTNKEYLYKAGSIPGVRTDFTVEKTSDTEITVTISFGVFGSGHVLNWTIIER